MREQGQECQIQRKLDLTQGRLLDETTEDTVKRANFKSFAESTRRLGTDCLPERTTDPCVTWQNNTTA